MTINNRYMIELHNVPHEISMYLEELKDYGEITHYNERFPQYVWIESPWDKDVVKEMTGIKVIRSPLPRPTGEKESVLKDIMTERGLV